MSTGRRGYGFVDEPPPLSTRSGAAPKLGSLFPTARAVASADARPSMMDVLPELPPSVEVAGADAASRTDAQLRLVEGGAEQVWRLSEDTVTIGSKDENAIVIKGEGVSRYHAELAREETGWVLKDLGARNGIFVAGARIDVYELTDGDEVQIGTCKLRFELASPDPLQAVHAVLERLKDDPVEAFKTDSRVRLSLAVLVTALLLAVMAVTGGPSGGGGGTRSGQLAFGPWLDEGATLLERGSYRQARGVFRQAKAHVSAKQDVPQVLESIAALWMNLERGPLAFRWEKASELIQLAARLEGSPTT